MMDFTNTFLHTNSSLGGTASNVQLVVNLPAGVVATAATNSAGTSQITSSSVTCAVASLPGNGSFTVTLTLRANFLPQNSDVVVNLVELTATVNSSAADADPADNWLSLPVTVRAQTDWGDARGGFPVTPAENGAYHRYSPSGPWLGARWDNDGLGNHSPLADFDDTHGASDDEDGIVFLPPLYPGLPALVQVTATASGFLDAWADFANDSDWTDPGEHIFTRQPLLPGANNLTIRVPATAAPGQITTRWRISAVGGLDFTGYGGPGEVEDHIVAVRPGLDPAELQPTIERTNNSLIIRWDNPVAVLEESIRPGGPYTTVPGATSPFTVPTGSAARKFFRLRLGSLPFEIPTTGQINFYGNTSLLPSAPASGQPFDGQDAKYNRPPMQYVDNGNGTISDLTTGLMWQKDLDGPKSWDAAVGGANTFNRGGYQDWRLPTIKELFSLFSALGAFGTTNSDSIPFMNTNYFDFFYLTGAGLRFFDVQVQSATKYVGTTIGGDETVFGVNFADGRIKGYPVLDPKTHAPATYYVRYVGGNPNYGNNQFVDDGDGTVSDLATGLMWQKADSGTTYNWKDALAYAENLTTAGYTDWRLPTVKELQSIVDYTRAPLVTGTAAINTNFFQVTTNESYYSSSTTIVDGPPGANFSKAGYLSFGQAFGYMTNAVGDCEQKDVHGAGAMRADFKSGDPSLYPCGNGPQDDQVRIYNYVRAVRGGLR